MLYLSFKNALGSIGKTIFVIFQAHVESTKFIVYICELLNRYTLINDNDKQFIILKSLAESVPYCGKLMNPEAVVAQVYQALLVSIFFFYLRVNWCFDISKMIVLFDKTNIFSGVGCRVIYVIIKIIFM